MKKNTHIESIFAGSLVLFDSDRRNLDDKFQRRVSFVAFYRRGVRGCRCSGVCRERVASDLYCINFRATPRLHAAITRGDVCTRVRTHASCPVTVGRLLARSLMDPRLPLSVQPDPLLDPPVLKGENTHGRFTTLKSHAPREKRFSAGFIELQKEFRDDNRSCFRVKNRKCLVEGKEILVFIFVI